MAAEKSNLQTGRKCSPLNTTGILFAAFDRNSKPSAAATLTGICAGTYTASPPLAVASLGHETCQPSTIDFTTNYPAGNATSHSTTTCAAANDIVSSPASTRGKTTLIANATTETNIASGAATEISYGQRGGTAGAGNNPFAPNIRGTAYRGRRPG